MKSNLFIKSLSLVALIALFLGSSVNAQDYEYVGSIKCKMCHNKSATGAQYKIWTESAHSKAMETLASEKALAYAKEHNIADPSTEPSCLKCHSTAGSIDESVNAGVKISEGVSCESCHGPGSGYKSKMVMMDHKKSLAKGLIIPTQETCEGCHNKDNPFYKPFDFAKYKAKIAHPIPDID